MDSNLTVEKGNGMTIRHIRTWFLALLLLFVVSCGSSGPENKVNSIINAMNRVTATIENNNPDEFMSAMDAVKIQMEQFKDSADAKWLGERVDDVEVDALQMKLSFAMRDFDSAMMDLRGNRKFAEAFATNPKRLKWIRETIPGLANFWNID